jgi:hypothetical protein
MFSPLYNYAPDDELSVLRNERKNFEDQEILAPRPVLCVARTGTPKSKKIYAPCPGRGQATAEDPEPQLIARATSVIRIAAFACKPWD